MKVLPLIVVAAMGVLASVCQAQLSFSGPAAMVGSPYSDAPLTPAAAYTITSPASGINLTGDFYVTPTGTGTGSMLQWVVDRPISGGTTSFNITTNYSGFISLSGGTNNGTGGVLISAIYNGGTIVAGSTCVVQFTQAGADDFRTVQHRHRHFVYLHARRHAPPGVPRALRLRRPGRRHLRPQLPRQHRHHPRAEPSSLSLLAAAGAVAISSRRRRSQQAGV